MSEKNEKKKGGKTAPAVCGLAVIIAALFGGKQLGFIPLGNDADNKNGDVSSSSSVVEEITEAPTTTEETTTEPETEEVKYIDITVSGNDYIYQNSTMSLEDLMENIKDTDMTVKLTDDKASKQAYEALTGALSENNIKYIE